MPATSTSLSRDRASKDVLAAVYIYALLDPATREPVYIGQTRRSLESRLYDHLHEVGSRAKQTWIKSLKVQGLRPLITPLFVTNAANANEAEKRIIKRYREMGYTLLNSNRNRPYTAPCLEVQGE